MNLLITATTGLLLFAPRSARADEPQPAMAKSGPEHRVGLSLASQLRDNERGAVGAAASYRAGWASGWQLGLALGAWQSEEGRVAGYAVDDTQELEALAVVVLPLMRFRPLAIDLHMDTGLRSVRGDDDSVANSNALLLSTHLGPVARIWVSKTLRARVGFLVPAVVEVSPTTQLESTGAESLAGLAYRLGRAVLHAEVRGGGLFGYDGDSTKFALSARVGVRWAFGNNSSLWDAER